MILYLIKSTLLLGVLLGLYKLLLENEKMHRFNRLYLIMALVLGFTAPLLTIDISTDTTIAGINSETINKVVNEPTQRVSASIEKVIIPSAPSENRAINPLAETTSNSFSVVSIFWWIYGIVFTLLLIRFIAGLLQIQTNIRKSELDQFGNATLVLMEKPITPQSFLQYIFLNKQEYQSGNIGSEILEHECTHVRQFHSVDVMFIELLKLIFWFNPLLYLYKHAIQLNHEFLADEYVVNNVTDITNYQKKLIEVCEAGTLTPVTSHFSTSNTKRRFALIKKEPHPFTVWMKVFMAVVLLGAMSPACMKFKESPQPEDIKALSERLILKMEEGKTFTEEEAAALTSLQELISKRKTEDRAAIESATDEELEKLKRIHAKLLINYIEQVENYSEMSETTSYANKSFLETEYARLAASNVFIKGIENQIREESAPDYLVFHNQAPRPFVPTPDEVFRGRNQ